MPALSPSHLQSSYFFATKDKNISYLKNAGFCGFFCGRNSDQFP